MNSQLDKDAAAYVCLKHSTLRGQLETLRSQYDQIVEHARDYAMRIEETEGQLEELMLNIHELYCDALDALGAPGPEDGTIQMGLFC